MENKKKRILFVCLGNICRSPMAEFIFKNSAEKAGRKTDFIVSSAGTSNEEQGNSMHPGAREKLEEEGVPCTPRSARQISPEDYEKYDIIVGMDDNNMSAMYRIFQGDPDHKCRKLLEYCNLSRSVADPWYTGNFDAAYEDIQKGCEAMLQTLK